MLNGTIKLTKERQKQFELAIKRGILKELHREGRLTDMQLRLLLSKLREQNICTSEKGID